MAKTKGPRKVRRYDNEFKVKAVKLSQLPGVQVKDVAASRMALWGRNKTSC